MESTEKETRRKSQTPKNKKPRLSNPDSSDYGAGKFWVSWLMVI